MNTLRGVVCGLAVFGCVHAAGAADLDYLRGSDVFEPQSETYFCWSGTYFGAQVGYANVNMDFTNSAASLIAYILRVSTLEANGNISQWPLLGRADVRDVSYGGFVGYNWQFQDAIIGVEANYNRASLAGQSSGSLERIVSPGDGLVYDTTVSAEGAMKITDYGTLRGRAGWAFGRFMPYVMLGLAGGRVETHRSATVSAIVANPADGTTFQYGPISKTVDKAGYAFGYAAGAGVDIALLPNVFVRGEFEWVQFSNLPDMKAEITTGRVAAGVKF